MDKVRFGQYLLKPNWIKNIQTSYINNNSGQCRFAYIITHKRKVYSRFQCEDPDFYQDVKKYLQNIPDSSENPPTNRP